jgi:peroxiredoxin
VIIDEPSKGIRKIGNKGFDPRYFFNNDGSTDFFKRLMLLYENADNPNITERHVKREGNLVIMTLEKTVEGGIRTKKEVFDLSVGGNLIELYSKGPTYEIHSKYEYEEKSGVWILKSYKKLNITHHEDGILRSTRTIKWSNSVVNVPLEEDEFTVEKLGLKHGDYIQDMIIGKLYRYEGVLAEAPPRPKSLTGKPLPQFEDFNIQISSRNTSDKMLLVCFWDMNQRPSRNCIMQLAKQANQLKQKGLTVVAVQASKVDKNALNKWIKRNNIPFNVGMIEDNEEKIRFAWGVKSLPWLILTDKKRIVRAEGFSINELDEKITMLTENK